MNEHDCGVVANNTAARLHDRIDKAINKAEVDHKESSHRIDTVERELHKWLNRGWGAWALAVLLAAVLQWIANQAIESIKSHAAEQTAIIKKMEGRINELESMVTAVMSTARRDTRP